MRLILLVPLLALPLSCTSTKDVTKSLGTLDGTWVPVSQEIGGKSLPKTAFENQKLMISDSTYIFSAESVDKGILSYGNDKMDIYGKEGVNAGKHFTAVYKREHDELTICYNLSGDGYPEGFATNASRSLFLSVFKKQ